MDLVSRFVQLTINGSIRIRCPECDSIFAFTPGLGSLPIEDDLGLHISQGRLKSRVSIGAPVDTFEGSTDTLSRVLLYACTTIIGIFIIAVVLLILLNSIP